MTRLSYFFSTVAALGCLSWNVSAADSNAVVAEWGNQKITIDEFRDYIKIVHPEMSKASPQAWGPILEDYLAFRMIVDEAERKGLPQKPEVKHQLRSVLYQKYLQTYVTPEIADISVKSSDIRAFYQKNPLVKTRQILFKFSHDAGEAEMQNFLTKAQHLRAEIVSKKLRFEDAAKKYSEDYSRDVGGLMPEGGAFNLIPVYYQTALALSPGQVAEPIKTMFGVHLITLVEKVPFAQISASYREEITAHLRSKTGNRKVQELVRDLRSKLAAKSYPERLQ